MSCIKIVCTVELFEHLQLPESMRKSSINHSIYCDRNISMALIFEADHHAIYPDQSCKLFINGIEIPGWITDAHGSNTASLSLHTPAIPQTIDRLMTMIFLNEALEMSFGKNNYAINISWSHKVTEKINSHEEDVARFNRMCSILNDVELDFTFLQTYLHLTLGNHLHFQAFIDKLRCSGGTGLSQISRQLLEKVGYIKFIRK